MQRGVFDEMGERPHKALRDAYRVIPRPDWVLSSLFQRGAPSVAAEHRL
jgi:hypothetical protein